ncbi:hypothetical protein VR010_03440 [Actinomycetaceae bacterium L2_0104]
MTKQRVQLHPAPGANPTTERFFTPDADAPGNEDRRAKGAGLESIWVHPAVNPVLFSAVQ